MSRPRTQPADTRSPMSCGSLVAWIASRSPPLQPTVRKLRRRDTEPVRTAAREDRERPRRAELGTVADHGENPPVRALADSDPVSLYDLGDECSPFGCSLRRARQQHERDDPGADRKTMRNQLPPLATPQPANHLLANPRRGRLQLPAAGERTRLAFLACCAPDFITRTIDLRRARALDLGPEQNGPSCLGRAAGGHAPSGAWPWRSLGRKPGPAREDAASHHGGLALA